MDASGFEGIYLAGDWVGDDGMLADAAVATARAAAHRIAHDLGCSSRREAPVPATMAAS